MCADRFIIEAGWEPSQSVSQSSVVSSISLSFIHLDNRSVILSVSHSIKQSVSQSVSQPASLSL